MTLTRQGRHKAGRYPAVNRTPWARDWGCWGCGVPTRVVSFLPGAGWVCEGCARRLRHAPTLTASAPLATVSEQP